MTQFRETSVTMKTNLKKGHQSQWEWYPHLCRTHCRVIGAVSWYGSVDHSWRIAYLNLPTSQYIPGFLRKFYNTAQDPTTSHPTGSGRQRSYSSVGHRIRKNRGNTRSVSGKDYCLRPNNNGYLYCTHQSAGLWYSAALWCVIKRPIGNASGYPDWRYQVCRWRATRYYSYHSWISGCDDREWEQGFTSISATRSNHYYRWSASLCPSVSWTTTLLAYAASGKANR